MDTGIFQADVKRTLNPGLTGEETILNAALGLGESGEVAGLVKKWRFQGHGLPADDVIDELGDVLYYATLMADQLGYGLDEVMVANMKKREKRYPKGFTVEASVNRSEG